MTHFTARWIYLILMVSQSSAYYYIQPPMWNICGRPRVNSTAPDVTLAEIHSPGFPSGYLGPHDCTITIVLPETSWIAFYVVDFSLRDPARGCTDSLTIRRQLSAENEQVHCGNISAYEMIFYDSTFHTREKIDVHFHALSFMDQQDSEMQKFNVEFIVADVIHPGENYNHSKPAVTNGYGYIISHSDFGNDQLYYESNINSYFTITDLRPKTVVEIYCIDFQLHDSDSCSDRLTISGASQSPNSQEPLTICGSTGDNTAYEMVTLGNSITFHFKTDNRNGGKGFRIQYYVKGYLDEENTGNGDTREGLDNVGQGTTPYWSRRTTRRAEDENKEKTNEGKNHKYLYLGLGVGAGNLVVIVLLAIGIVFCVRKRKKRLAKETSKRSRYTDSTRTGPLPPTSGYSYENRTKGKGNAAVELYDDESAYYSEIGTFQKKREEADIHYASRAVCDANFYHVVEEPDNTPPPPSSPPVPATTHESCAARPPIGPIVMPPPVRQDYFLPYPTPATDDSYNKNNDRLNAVRIEYQPRSWKNSHGLQRF